MGLGACGEAGRRQWGPGPGWRQWGEKWVDFGGSLLLPWCLGSGAWARVKRDIQCPGCHIPPFLEMGNRSWESHGSIWGPPDLPGCRTGALVGSGPTLWLPGLLLLPGSMAHPPAEWQLSDTSISPCQVQIKEKPKYISLCRNPVRVSRAGVIRYCVLGPTLLLT